MACLGIVGGSFGNGRLADDEDEHMHVLVPSLLMTVSSPDRRVGDDTFI